MDLMQKIVSLAKRRGIIYPGSEIYGGLSNSWDYGPVGVELKNNIKKLWWRIFVHKRDDIYGLDAAILMNSKIWEASGHLEHFTDPLVECKKCRKRFRADDLEISKHRNGKCPECGGELGEVRKFNTMFKTFIGPVEDEGAITYLRPETAQAIFVDFKNVVDSLHPKLPFGIAQIGKAFRNEITPGNFIFRTREFEQMEIEYFVREENWEEQFEKWIEEMKSWLALLGIAEKNIIFREVPEDERAHYSKRTVDIDYEFPFGQNELYGLAYRGDFDLRQHQEKSGEDLSYEDPKTKEHFLPHVIEPSLGVDRTLLAVLLEAYKEEKVKDSQRAFLKLPPYLAPYKVAVFPLLANKPELVKEAGTVYEKLKKNTDWTVAWDDIGNIGKRYRRQDEIGTPYCITVDFDTLKDDMVTVRDRDTLEQERVKTINLMGYLGKKLS